MSPYDADLLDSLLATRSGPCLSIHLPLSPWETDERAVRVRWRSLLRRAAELLRHGGTRGEVVEAVLHPAFAFDVGAAVAGRRAEGLAAWLAPGFFRTEILDRPPEESVVVGPRFRLAPMLAARARSGRFHLLAFSPHRVRLFSVSTRSAAEIDVEDLPRSLEDLLARERRAADAAAVPSAGNGHGAAAGPRCDPLERFCRAVDAAVANAIRTETTPLLLACTPELGAVYDRVSTAPQRVPDLVAGNPDLLHAGELADRGREVLEARFRRTEEEAIARFGTLEGSGLTATSADEIVPAAFAGRVETLLLEAESERPSSDVAAVEALRHGASVLVIERARMPRGPMAAILR